MEVNDYNENYISGWVKVFRSIRKHWIWQDPVKFQWWIDILLEVNHAGKKVNIGYDLFDCEKGQSIMSLQNWAKRWNVSKDTARNFLKLLAKDNMINIENLKKTTRITVCNYDTYQVALHYDQTQSKRKANAKQTPSDPNKNVKNDKNKRIKEDTNSVFSFDEFWSLYPKKVQKSDCRKKFNNLKEDDRQKIKDTINDFIYYKPFEAYTHPNPATYINQRRWEDEIKPQINNDERQIERTPEHIRKSLGIG